MPSYPFISSLISLVFFLRDNGALKVFFFCTCNERQDFMDISAGSVLINIVTMFHS